MNDDRIAKLKEFLERDPEDSFTRYALAMEYEGRGDYERAIRSLEDLLGRDPSYVPAYQQLGSIYHRVDRSEEARRVLQLGINAARRRNDHHAAAEMQEVLDELQDI